MRCIPVSKVIRAVQIVNAVSGTGSITRPTEKMFLYESRNNPSVFLSFPSLNRTPDMRFNPSHRFHDKVELVIQLLGEDGCIDCRTRRGWRRVSDPERIADELEAHVQDVLTAHVREAQWRISHGG